MFKYVTKTFLMPIHFGNTFDDLITIYFKEIENNYFNEVQHYL